MNEFTYLGKSAPARLASKQARLQAASKVVLLGQQPAHLPFLPRHIWEKVLSYTDLQTCLLVSNLIAAKQFIATDHNMAMDQVIAQGHLGPVQILTHHGIGRADMNTAARHGHLHLLEFLHLYSPGAVRLCERGIASAALRKHHHIVIWSFQHYPGHVGREVMDSACIAGSLEIVTWLHKNSNLRCSQYAISFVALSGIAYADILDILHEVVEKGCSHQDTAFNWTIP